jgi:hypothetical protein
VLSIGSGASSRVRMRTAAGGCSLRIATRKQVHSIVTRMVHTIVTREVHSEGGRTSPCCGATRAAPSARPVQIGPRPRLTQRLHPPPHLCTLITVARVLSVVWFRSKCSVGGSLKSAKFHPPHALNAVDAHALLTVLSLCEPPSDVPREHEPPSPLATTLLPRGWRQACCCHRPRVRYAPGGAGKLPPGRATTYWAGHCALNWTRTGSF